MTLAIETLAAWLVDYYLLATALLATTLVAFFVVKQPAQRLAITKATLIALVLLAALTALPGWSLVHLLSDSQTELASSPLLTNDRKPRPSGPLDLPSTNQSAPVDVRESTRQVAAINLGASHSDTIAGATDEFPWSDILGKLPWQTWLVALQAIGAAVVAAWLAAGAIAARRLRRGARPAPSAVIDLLRRAASEGDETQRAPALLLSDQIEVAVALGVLRPAILLPTKWIETETPAALRSVLAHEMAHIRAGDLRWLAVGRALLLLHWLQPLYWLLRRRMRLDQETLADAAAAALTTREEYAEQLVAWARTARMRPGLRLSSSVGLWEGPSQLKRRIAILLDDRFTVLRNCPGRWRSGAALFATLLAVLLSFVTLEPVGHADTKATPESAKVELDYLPIRVVDESGSPIPGVTLELAGVKIPSGPSLIATTDDQGFTSLPYPGRLLRRLGSERQLLQATHPQFVSLHHSVDLVPTTSDTVLRMARGGAVEITGFAAGNEELANNIHGMATTLPQNAAWSQSGPHSIRSPQLPAGEVWVRIVALPPEGPALFSEMTPVTVAENKTGSLRLELKPGRKLEGRIDDSVPRPITGGKAAVWIRSSQGDHVWSDSTPINDDGSFVFDSLPLDSATEARVIAICDGFVSQPPADPETLERNSWVSPHIVPVGDGTARCELSMIPTARCIATVRDSNGNPIEGVQVTTFPAILWEEGFTSLLTDTLRASAKERLQANPNDPPSDGSELGTFGVTDEAGQAEIANLPPFDNYITAGHQDYELLPQSIGGQQFPVAMVKLSPGKTTLLNLTMLALAIEPTDEAAKPQPTELTGRVVDQSGKPLAGVTVDVWTWYPGNETKTDEEGRFMLAGFEPNEALQVEFRHEGYGPRHFIEQPAGSENWIVTMKNDTFLEGRVTGPDGSAVPNAKVRAKRGPFENPQVVIGEVWTETVADDDGRYRLDLEPDTYDIQLRIPEVGLARHEGVKVGEGEQRSFDIKLKKGPTFRAVLLDSRTNEAVSGLRLWNWMQPGIEGVSGADGVLTISSMLPGEFEFNVSKAEGKEPHELAGDYARWWSPDAKHAWQRLLLEDGESNFQRNFDSLTFDVRVDMEPVKIFVEKCATIRGRVVDPAGNPVAGATVAPAKTGSGNSLTGDTRYSYETSADGTFEMRLPASGAAEYNLVAHDGKYQEWRRWANGVSETFKTAPGDTLTDFELRLTEPCIVRGKVVDADGKPLAGHRVRAHAADKLENRYYDPTATTNADGLFELAFVRPGEHYIQADPFWLAAEEGPSKAWKRVTVSPNEPVENILLEAVPPQEGSNWLSRPPVLEKLGDQTIDVGASGVPGSTDADGDEPRTNPQKPATDSPPPGGEQSSTQQPAPAPKDGSDRAALVANPTFIIAEHVLLHDGQIVDWAEVERIIERRVTKAAAPTAVTPAFKFTHGALPREQEIREKIWKLRERVNLAGHSWGSILPRASARYDSVRSAADLVPEVAHRVEGIVVNAEGDPVSGVEIVLCPPVPESVPYKTLDITLRGGRLRDRHDEIVTESGLAGKFKVYPSPETPYYLLALHPDGFALVRSDEFAKSHRIELAPWAKITGRIMPDVRFTQSLDVDMVVSAEGDWPELSVGQYGVDVDQPAPTGRFELQYIPPGIDGVVRRDIKTDHGSIGLPFRELKLAPDESIDIDIPAPTPEEVERFNEMNRR